MTYEDEAVAQPGSYGTVMPAYDPNHHAAIASIRTTLIFTILLGTGMPIAAFVCGIVLLVKSSTPSNAQGLVAFTGILSLFGMPVITALVAIITLAVLSSKNY